MYEFKLLSVSQIDDLDDEEIELTRAELVEMLAQHAADFGRE